MQVDAARCRNTPGLIENKIMREIDFNQLAEENEIKQQVLSAYYEMYAFMDIYQLTRYYFHQNF